MSARPKQYLPFYALLTIILSLIVIRLFSLSILGPTSISGYFSALNTQNPAYDLNRDGLVTGADYTLLLRRIEPEPSVKGLATAQANDETIANLNLPSVQNFGSDDFNGAATLSYPLELPPGPAGITPTLSLTYSSASVDDLYLGTFTNLRSSPDHPYQNQSGLVGLGWNLGGIQYIARDTNGTYRLLEDDKFILSFAGGGASLAKESDDGSYSVWRTVPNLKIKVERWAKCKQTGNSQANICRHHWLVTAGDGTKYYFGSQNITPAWQRPLDPDTNEDLKNKESEWYPLYDNDSNPIGSRAWQVWGWDAVGYHALETRWYLSKTESIFDKDTIPVEINYTYSLNIEPARRGGDSYTPAVYPSAISWGKHELTFPREPRLDYKIHEGDNSDPPRPTRFKDRLKKIIIKTNSKIRGVYKLEYQYGWDKSKHADNGNGIPDNDGEVKSGQVIHSLLTKITRFSDDPDTNPAAKRLPGYTFSYGPNCDNFTGGCPLTSFVTTGTSAVAKTPYDFFLVTADNGLGGKTTYEYFKDTNNSHTVNIKYCDRDKITLDNKICKTDNELNTQRHRLSAKITEDGMGNSVRTVFNYGGAGATLGLGSVSSYKESDEATTTFNNFANFEFLGYPEVEVTTYEKGSSSQAAAKSKSFFYQALETGNCFKPSPLKGIAYKTINYTAGNTNRSTETTSTYTVRFGPMFGPWQGAYDWDINTKCGDYDPQSTVSLVIPRDTVNKEIVAGTPKLCTRIQTDHRKLDLSDDIYAQLHIATNYGKVSCSDPNQDDNSDTKKITYTDYTAADTLRWILPLPNQTWISDSSGGTKFNHSQTTYNSLGQPTRISQMQNGSAYASASLTYDSAYPWLLTKSTDPLGRNTSTTYDNIFHLYPIKITNHLGQSAVTTYDFNTTDSAHPNKGGVLGLPVAVSDVNGAQTTYVYDVFGRLVETYLPGKKPGGTAKPNSFSKYYYFNDSDISPCNEANHCLTDLGRQAGGKGPKILVTQGTRFDDSGVSGKVSAAHTYYNGLGQTVQARQLWYENQWSNAGIPVENEYRDLLTSQTYTALGQIEYQSLTYTAAPYTPGAKSSYDNRNIVSTGGIPKIKYTYDGLGRITMTNYPDASFDKTEYDIDGNPLVVKYSNKNCYDPDPATPCTTKTATADAFGQTLTTLETSGSKNLTTGFQYHPVLGQVIQTKDPLGNVVNRVEYDVLGRKTKLWDVDMSPAMTGDANSWRYEYDKANNLTKQTNPKGEVTSFSYDGLNRLLTKSLGGTLLLQNIYDTCTSGKGKVCATRSYNPDTAKMILNDQLQYDKRGRVTKDTLTLSNLPNSALNNQKFITLYSYDQGGRIKSQVRFGNTAIGLPAEPLTYTYDRPYPVSLVGNSTYVTQAKYNQNGQLIKFTSGNGVANTFSYDPNNQRLNTLKIQGPNLSDADELLLSYTYDWVGNIKKITDDNPLVPVSSPFHLTQNFTYDGLSRLTAVSGAYSAGFSYDDLGNIKTKTEGPQSVALSYGNFGSSFYHRPQTGTVLGRSVNYAYDALGNLTSDTQKTYTYDKDNRLAKSAPTVSVDTGLKETKFLYSSSGARIAKLVTGGESTYYINPDIEINIPVPGTINWTQNYYFSGKLVAVRKK